MHKKSESFICICSFLNLSISLGIDIMTMEEKIRYGMLALAGLGLLLPALGIKITPLEPINGAGFS